MIAVADEEALYHLGFTDYRKLERQLNRIQSKTNAVILPGTSSPLQSIEHELNAYFSGVLAAFKTPLALLGSPFQKQVWEELQHIPFGQTRSYAHVAGMIGNPTAFRAVANANGANHLSIIIPCHRVINTGGALGGYGGGLDRKQWLLDHEKQ
jgi:AraC family transcriptional regulator of adaptative response/methylated-DNA-[protein]-cysteine methyltransferase